MSLGTSLKDLRQMLKAEVGYVQAANLTLDTELNFLLSAKQKWFALVYTWPFLEDRWSTSASARYIDFPTTDDQGNEATLAKESPFKVETYFNNFWLPLEYGITSDQYNSVNSDLSETQDPIQRWRFAGNQFEIWPLPVSAQTIRISGQRELNPLLADADTADLDDLLLVLAVAGDRLQKLKQSNWQEKVQLARERLLRLRGGMTRNAEDFILGGLPVQEPKPELVKIAIAS